MITLTFGDIGLLTFLTTTISSLIIYIWNLKNNTFNDRLLDLSINVQKLDVENEISHKKINTEIYTIQKMESRFARIETNVDWIKKYLEHIK